MAARGAQRGERNAGIVSFSPEQHYDRIADAWPLLLGEEFHFGVFESGGGDLPTATARLTDLMLEAARIRPSDHVLDVGCGTGAPACRIASETGAQVTGISTSSEGVRAGRSRAAARGLSRRVSFELRDGTDSGFRDGAFTRAWALESSLLMRDRERLISEMARVLQEGGRLALCDQMLRRPLNLREVRRLREPLGVLRDVFGETRVESLTEYARLAERAGLVVDRQEDLTLRTRPTFARWRENAGRNREEVVALLGEDYWFKFLRSCDLLEAFWDDGTFGYGLLAAFKP